MQLVIVESPSKAKTIEKYLGDGYVVRASVGHVRDIPKSSKNAIDIEGGFVPQYQIVKGKERVIDELSEARTLSYSRPTPTAKGRPSHGILQRY